MFDPPVYDYQEANIKSCVCWRSEADFEVHLNRDGLMQFLESLDSLSGRVGYYEEVSVWAEQWDSFPCLPDKVIELLQITVIPLQASITTSLIGDGRFQFQALGSKRLDIYATRSEAVDAWGAVEMLSLEKTSLAKTKILSVLTVTVYNDL